MARFLWNALLIAFNFQPPKNNIHMFVARGFGIYSKFEKPNKAGFGSNMLGFAWLNTNDTMFDKKNSNSFLQVIFRGTY